MPQIGPGKSARFENHVRDDGRLRAAGLEAEGLELPLHVVRVVPELLSAFGLVLDEELHDRLAFVGLNQANPVSSQRGACAKQEY